MLNNRIEFDTGWTATIFSVTGPTVYSGTFPSWLQRNDRHRLWPNVNVNLPPSILAEIRLGTTVSGPAKVFTLSTARPVRVSASADLTVSPEISASISTGFSGSRLVISSQNFPPCP